VKIGETIAGRYRLEGVLGRGGMSSVYWAHDGVLERDVAVKVLHERLSADPDQVERFRREARAIASLSHPNIVTLIDRGQVDGDEYMVFELVRGLNLKDFLDARPGLPVAQALGLVLQAARGLAYAHERGIVHRDVKPQNVLVNDEGVAKVTDFGIARNAGLDDSLTQTGTILGTTDYLSPEQAQGQAVDERADQYSLGVVLYELLAGAPPYPADSAVAVAMRHVHDPVPSLRERRPDVSRRVDALVQRAMAKNPDDRFRTMSDLAVAIEACLAEEGGTPRWLAESDTASLEPVSPARARRRRERRRRSVPWRLLLALAVIAAGVAAVAAVATGRIDVRGGSDKAPGDLNVTLKAISDYDPIGADGEHPDLVDLATDGDPATAWTTEEYLSFDKDGVGIMLDAGRKVMLDGIVVVSDDPGFSAEILAANKPDGNFRPVSDEQVVEAQTTFELDTKGKEFRYYVVWITSLDGHVNLNEVRAAD
jgi:hypothetical protein